MITVDPEREYSDGEESPGMLGMNIFDFRSNLQQSSNHRIYRKSMSLPHSPSHYTIDLSEVSLDDLDILDTPTTEASTIRSFDSAHYITQNDNFQVNEMKMKTLQEDQLIQKDRIGSLGVYFSREEKRNCAISAKKIHYKQTSPDDRFNDESTISEAEGLTKQENRNDNPAKDPTWSPRVKSEQINNQKSTQRVKKMKNVKTKMTTKTKKHDSKTAELLMKSTKLIVSKKKNHSLTHKKDTVSIFE